MKKEPIRHHYIPQFILRNFCFDDENHLYYHDKNTGQVSVKETRDVFMSRNLYRDEINNPEEPTKIEHDFSKYEREISELIKNKFISQNRISITIEENNSLMLFLAIMGFRAERVQRTTFGNEAPEANAEFYSVYQEDGNLTDFWKRNLGELVNCRSIEEVTNNEKIDVPVKIFMQRDTVGLFGKYIVVVENRGLKDFILGDPYPIVFNGINDMLGTTLDMYSVFPISPNRAIISANNGVEGAPETVRFLSKEVLKKPSFSSDNQHIVIKVKKVYQREVEHINSSIIENSSDGWIFQDRERI